MKGCLQALCLLLCLLFSNLALAQYFGNSSVELPSLGYMALPGFAVSDQVTIGGGYSQIVSERLWAVASTLVGFGQTTKEGQQKKLLSTVQAMVGLKYNFFEEEIRPYMALHVQYLRFMGEISEQGSGNLAKNWVGFRPSLGLEWFFGNEMSVNVEISYAGYFSWGEPYNHAPLAKAAYNIYF